MKKESPLFKQYSALVHPQRVEFLNSRGINYFMGHQNPRELLAFLLVWTGFSIKMTEKVENWIQRAGEKCDHPHGSWEPIFVKEFPAACEGKWSATIDEQAGQLLR